MRLKLITLLLSLWIISVSFNTTDTNIENSICKVQCGLQSSSGFIFINKTGTKGVLTSLHSVIKSCINCDEKAGKEIIIERKNIDMGKFKIHSFDDKNDVAFLVPVKKNTKLDNLPHLKISEKGLRNCSTLTAYAHPYNSLEVDNSSLCLSSKNRFSFTQWLDYHSLLDKTQDYKDHPLNKADLFDFTDDKKVKISWSGGAIINENGELVSLVNGGLQTIIVPTIFGVDLKNVILNDIDDNNLQKAYKIYKENKFNFSEKDGKKIIDYESLSQLIIEDINNLSRKNIKLKKYYKLLFAKLENEKNYNPPKKVILNINGKYETKSERHPYVEYSVAMAKKQGIKTLNKIRVGIVIRKNLNNELELYAELYNKDGEYLLNNFKNKYEVKIPISSISNGNKVWSKENFLLEVIKYKYEDRNGNNCKLIILDIQATQINKSEVEIIYKDKSNGIKSKIKYPECNFNKLKFDEYLN